MDRKILNSAIQALNSLENINLVSNRCNFKKEIRQSIMPSCDVLWIRYIYMKESQIVFGVRNVIEMSGIRGISKKYVVSGKKSGIRYKFLMYWKISAIKSMNG